MSETKVSKIPPRLLFWGPIAALITLGLMYSFWPRALPIDLSGVELAPLRVSIIEEGKTQVHDVYTLSAPVNGKLRRISWEVGDSIADRATVVARIEPIDSAFLDSRSMVQAEADIKAAESAKKLATAAVNEASAEYDFAAQELDRLRKLRLNEVISERDFDNAERLYKTRRAALATSQAALEMRRFELDRVKAMLLSPSTDKVNYADCDCLSITSPVSGKILKIHHKNEGVVQAGSPLVEIGDPENLEVVVELLSSDAVKVVAGQKVLFHNWGGESSLEGRVTRIEPIGFTKVSALGIEEQRVNVIIDFVSEQLAFSKLGHGYQLDAEIILWQQEQVLSIPLTAIFREQDTWQVFKSENGRTKKQTIRIGRKNGLRVEVVEGLSKGDIIVKHPSSDLTEGQRIAQRKTS